MKHIFIVNPISGAGKGLRVSNNIDRVCKEKELDYTIHFTSGPKDATRIAGMYKHHKNHIYSVGGDGTLSEVLNGIIGSENVLSVVPSGSGNDFFKTLKNINGKEIIDIGKINDLYFINIASIGIDAEVAYNVNILKEFKIPSSQEYNASIIYSLLKYSFKEIEFELNQSCIKGQYTLLTICNGQYYGGGFRIAPEAQINDGLFDVYFADKMSKLLIPHMVLKLKKGTHESSRYVNKKKADSIMIQSENLICCNVDGEIIIDNKFDIKIIKNAVQVFNDKEWINQLIEF